MSGVNIGYEIDSSDGGEFKYLDNKLNSEHSGFANILAGEIVNDILENALDIATRASQTGFHWREIKELKSNLKTSMSSTQINDDSSDEAIEKLNIPIDDICVNIVGDIVENYGEVTSPPPISQIIESLNNMNRDECVQEREVQPLDVEMKKLLSEMLNPPYEIINYECVSIPGGVGDQPYSLVENECATSNELTPRPVEKKSRVTDLVKNSPHIISEFLVSKKSSRQNQDEWEEDEEEAISVIELECIQPGEEPFRAPPNPYRVPKEEFLAHEYDEEAICKTPQNEVMETVNLSSQAFREEHQRLSCKKNELRGDLAKGDEQKTEQKEMQLFNTVPVENKSKGVCDLNSKLRDVAAVEVCQEKVKKKKVSFGHRILGFFKKSHKEVAQSSSTSA